ncbi:MAG TPA: type II secretion system F family protein, partial [Ramlibacter sp.]|nr:type II secretion system F family protein [Ramlibacter sp.]
MSTMQILFLALIFVVVMAISAGLLFLLRPNEARQRLRQLVADEQKQPGRDTGWMKFVADLTRPISELASPEEGFEQSSVKLRFVHAGIRHPSAPTAFFGIKTALTLGLPLFGFAALAFTGSAPKGNNLLMLLLLLAAVGYYAPNLVLNSMVKRRQREIFENFPDALDLMTVCVEAGLGTEAAMMRVAKDMQVKSPALGDEMRLVNLELRAGSDRERALRNLAFRTGVDEIDGFVTMISQAERFGTSIAAS